MSEVAQRSVPEDCSFFLFLVISEALTVKAKPAKQLCLLCHFLTVTESRDINWS